jgi:hypothetical protein
VVWDAWGGWRASGRGWRRGHGGSAGAPANQLALVVVVDSDSFGDLILNLLNNYYY